MSADVYIDAGTLLIVLVQLVHGVFQWGRLQERVDWMRAGAMEVRTDHEMRLRKLEARSGGRRREDSSDAGNRQEGIGKSE
jgi:hypothetical protein